MADENGKAEALVTENPPGSIGVDVPNGMTLPNHLPLGGGNSEKHAWVAEQEQEFKKMKKLASLVGLAVFFSFASVELDVAAAECQGGFAAAPGSDLRDGISGTLQAACVDKERFHIPAAVPLFLSAIAGLGIVALRGNIR